MQNTASQTKEMRAYLLLTSLVICGLAGSLITAPKIVYFGVSFPFSNIVFSILTYPIIDCICEIWGKSLARQAMWFALSSQIFIAIIIQLSIVAPHASFWHFQSEYQTVLATGVKVVSASVIAFAVSQLLDIVVYQWIKEKCRGRWLWLRINVSTFLGQTIDSLIFINIVFFYSSNKLAIFGGSILVKIILSFLMTPFVYLMIYSVKKYLQTESEDLTGRLECNRRMD